MSYTYGDIETKGYLKAGSYVKATTYVEATTYVKAGTTVKAVGGLALKTYIAKCPTSGSVAVTGLSVGMLLESVYGVRLSQASTGIVKVMSVADLTTAATIGAAKLILATVKAMSNSPLWITVHDPR